jgi:hypothetical protein
MKEEKVLKLFTWKILVTHYQSIINFCGLQNLTDYVPNTMLDDICQYNDLLYANKQIH